MLKKNCPLTVIEEVRREYHRNATSYTEQILENPTKRAAEWLPTFHLEMFSDLPPQNDE